MNQQSLFLCYLPVWLVKRDFTEEVAILIGLLVVFRCLGIGDPTVGVEDSEDKPESRPSSPFRLEARPASSSTSALPLARSARSLPVKTVRFFAPLDTSDADEAITLDQPLYTIVQTLVSHRFSLFTYFFFFITFKTVLRDGLLYNTLCRL